MTTGNAGDLRDLWAMLRISRLKSVCSALLVTILSTGCAQFAARQEVESIRADMKRTWNDPRFDVIRDKIPFDYNNMSSRFLLVDSYPNEAEIEALLLWEEASHVDAKKVNDFFIKYLPYAIPARIAQKNRFQMAFAELLKKRLTYSEFNRLNAQSYALFMAQLQEAEIQYASLRNQQRATQLAASRLLIEASRSFQRPTKILDDGVRYTNCQWIGNTMNCQTY